MNKRKKEKKKPARQRIDTDFDADAFMEFFTYDDAGGNDNEYVDDPLKKNT